MSNNRDQVPTTPNSTFRTYGEVFATVSPVMAGMIGAAFHHPILPPAATLLTITLLFFIVPPTSHLVITSLTVETTIVLVSYYVSAWLQPRSISEFVAPLVVAYIISHIFFSVFFRMRGVGEDELGMVGQIDQGLWNLGRLAQGLMKLVGDLLEGLLKGLGRFVEGLTIAIGREVLELLNLVGDAAGNLVRFIGGIPIGADIEAGVGPPPYDSDIDMTLIEYDSNKCKPYT